MSAILVCLHAMHGNVSIHSLFCKLDMFTNTSLPVHIMQGELIKRIAKELNPKHSVYNRLCDPTQPHAIHLNAKPLFAGLPRRRARDDAYVEALRRRLYPLVSTRSWLSHEANQ